jgi:uncharacterized membrane protein YkoI
LSRRFLLSVFLKLVSGTPPYGGRRIRTPPKEQHMPRKVMAGAAAVAAAGLGVVGVGWAAGGGGPSRLDDGKDLLPQATISERQAISAAQTAASGAVNEVDLERVGGQLVFNVDVGDADVKVDAATGQVVRVDHDD